MEWIKTSEILPKLDEEVLLIGSLKISFCFKDDKELHQNKQFVGFMDDISVDNEPSWRCVYGDGFVPFNGYEVHHWMPLPFFPEK